ncbi:hypothetical protein [Salibacterium halotolerans]|uniref:hypothetical protein n=1 Tax=Salibacterium halotolerans TaxID=1884432 RepID=UPI001BAEEC36|nr:hypothetical protein [Salibacterium halotolerans]
MKPGTRPLSLFTFNTFYLFSLLLLQYPTLIDLQKKSRARPALLFLRFVYCSKSHRSFLKVQENTPSTKPNGVGSNKGASLVASGIFRQTLRFKFRKLAHPLTAGTSLQRMNTTNAAPSAIQVAPGNVPFDLNQKNISIPKGTLML